MPVFSPIDVEALLIGLVGHTVPHFGAEHHLVTGHEVEHHVLQDGHESLLVNLAEIDLVICGDLNSHVSLDIVDESSDLLNMVLCPLSYPRIFILHYFEKQDVTGASGNKCGVIDEIHLTQVHISHPVESIIAALLAIDDEGLALSVEGIDLVFLFVVEAPVREVLLGADQLSSYDVTIDCLAVEVVNKVVVLHIVVVEQVHEDFVRVDEGTGHEGVREGLVAHCVVVDL